MKSSSVSTQNKTQCLNPRDKTDHFYELHLHFEGSGKGDHSVYYRTPMELSSVNVPRYAVRDGDFLDVFQHNVDYVLEITPEEYFEHMLE